MTSMLHQLRSRLITVQEVHSAAVQRINHVQNLNAYINVTEDLSRVQMLESTTRYATMRERPLEGIPVAVKDNFCTKRVPTTCASKMLENFVPTYDATVVDKLLNAGALLMGKTNLDEFGMGSGTTESIFGPTKNYWGSASSNTRTKATIDDDEDFFIAGGSSGGSAVAVASGTCVAALGSDTGGSVRNPASYCGVVGFKPSYGSVSRYGLIPLVNSMDVPGILTQNVADCKVIFDTIKGCDVKDPTTIPRHISKSKVKSADHLRGLTVGIPKEYHCSGLSSEMVAVWDRVADLLANNGANVIQVSLPHTEYSIACYSVLNPCEVASNMARYDGLRYGYRAQGDGTDTLNSLYAATRSQAFNETVRGRILAGNYFLLKENYEKYFVQALKLRRLIYEDYAQVWRQGVDLLLTPVTLTDAPLHSEFKRHDSRAQSAQQDFCTQPANMSGIPALSLPIQLSQRGLPLSLQLMAPFFDDNTLLDVALFVEKNVTFPQPRSHFEN